eukprot:TRINITY_DN8652_c0_g1_i1.p3 TRINITY_DN8652_c0_g1~~TRINITY_DN8652_c0_g1_i1.p3  ORF type:complete len:107 (+),score=7.50 TRINITY_DN8652_c0_g1_i1:252-572(+)
MKHLKCAVAQIQNIPFINQAGRFRCHIPEGHGIEMRMRIGIYQQIRNLIIITAKCFAHSRWPVAGTKDRKIIGRAKVFSFQRMGQPLIELVQAANVIEVGVGGYSH